MQDSEPGMIKVDVSDLPKNASVEDVTSKLRKSIHSIATMPLYRLEALLQLETVNFPITEKTDGFSFEVGYDSDGFWARSASSEKMRKVGCFSKVAAKKFGGREDFDPMISLRLDFAHHVLRRCRVIHDFVRQEKTSLAGEMILVIDETVFSPNDTYFYYPNFGTFGTFVIHTRKPANYHLSAMDIKHLTDSRDHTFLKIDHDVPENSKVRVNISDLNEEFQKIKQDPLHVQTLRQKLNDQFASYLPTRSKWSSGNPEGFIVHTGNYCFKVMFAKNQKPNPNFSSYVPKLGTVLPLQFLGETT